MPAVPVESKRLTVMKKSSFVNHGSLQSEWKELSSEQSDLFNYSLFQLETVFKNCISAVQVLDLEGKTKYVNDAFIALFGLISTEKIFTTCNFFKDMPYPPSQFKRKMQKILRGESVCLHEASIDFHTVGAAIGSYRKDVLTVTTNAIPIANPQNKVVYILLLRQDLSLVERANSKADLSESKFKKIVEQSFDGILFVDKKGIIVECNHAQTKITGLQKEEMIGVFVWDMQLKLMSEERRKARTKSDDKKVLKEILTCPTSSWYGKIIDSQIQTASGQNRNVQSCVFPVFDNKGMFEGFGMFTRDVTELKRSAHLLEQHRQDLETYNNELHNKNIALHELIKRVEAEKDLITSEISLNIDTLIAPLFSDLRKHISKQGEKYLDLLESNLNDIISPFTRKISKISLNLTPKEVDICHLIAKNKTSKEISELHNISVRTVEKHRNNIRKKMGITDMSINLSTYLNHCL